MDELTQEIVDAQQPDTAPDKGGEDARFTQAQVDAIVKDRVAREREKTAKAAETARAEAERKAAEEQGKFRELYEQTKAEAEAAKAEAEQARREAMRDRIGRKHGLPEALISRLAGNDEAEIEADAQLLSAALPRQQVAGTDAGRGVSSAKPATPIYQRYGGKDEFAARLGLNPKFLPD